ncbi:hypothetical protein [Citrobacter portucalensis]|uniref:hypothetical protein n=1 Tax=Citrobacter portucalensis TaxID=1639133 RepID=UPI003CF5C0BE
MEMIDHYKPDYVVRFNSDACSCPACLQAPEDWPYVSIALKNQQRESMDIGCESVAKAILLDPEAFTLHVSRTAPQGEQILSPWNEMLNQQCINLAVHPAMPLEVSLYAIGVLLSKAQQHHDKGDTDPMLLQSMGEQLAMLAEQGVLERLFEELPPIPHNTLAALKTMGQMHLTLNLPMVEKMGVMLKLSELAILPATRLEERLKELTLAEQSAAQQQIMRYFLIYKLYHNVFPGVACENYGEAFLALATTFFRIRMLCALGVDNEGILSTDTKLVLISALSRWEIQHPVSAEQDTTPDYSLLCGLSLL